MSAPQPWPAKNQSRQILYSFSLKGEAGQRGGRGDDVIPGKAGRSGLDFQVLAQNRRDAPRQAPSFLFKPTKRKQKMAFSISVSSFFSLLIRQGEDTNFALRFN
jgi:hypothetical protein